VVEARLLESVFPTDTNPQGNLFGGTLVSWMDKAAGYAAIRRARSSVVTAAVEDIAFDVPIVQGDLVEVVARVVSVGRSACECAWR
jgi:acyl-CoA hydrolase